MTLILEFNNDYTSALRKLQLATFIEKILLEVPYTRDIKQLRRELRQSLRDLRDIIGGLLVSVKFTEISQRVRRVILREIERVLKCKLTRAIGDVQLSVRFFEKKIIIGLNIGTTQPLYRRWYTRYKSPASLNPVIAAALCLIAGKHDIVLDPFAGSLTIPIEYYRMWRPHKILCIDINREVLTRAKSNIAQIEGVEPRVDIICGDYFKINIKLNVPCIVTDPPRGLRLSASRKFYEKMADKFKVDLQDEGVAVFPVFKHAKKFIDNLFRGRGFDIQYPACTIQGGLKVFIAKAIKH